MVRAFEVELDALRLLEEVGGRTGPGGIRAGMG